MGCGFITRLGCTKPLWCIGNWCMASPPCSDITIRTARQETVHQKTRHSFCTKLAGFSPKPTLRFYTRDGAPSTVSAVRSPKNAREKNQSVPRQTITIIHPELSKAHPYQSVVPGKLIVSCRRSGEFGTTISFCSIPQPPRPPSLRVLCPNWSILLIPQGPESQNGRQVINNRVSSPLMWW